MDNKQNERLVKYLCQNGEFPFKKREKVLFLKGTITDDIYMLLNDFLKKLEIYTIKDVNILFYEEDGPININEIFQTISDDFGLPLFIHEALTINKLVPGSLIIDYLNYVNQSKILNKEYSNLSDIVFGDNKPEMYNFLCDIKKYLIDPVLNKNNNREILDTFFKNDLNVLKTSKELYLNRNSLTNRLEIISRDIGLNVQSFKPASIVLILMNLR